VLESRFADGRYERFPDLARELGQAGASVILVSTIAAVRAAQRLDPAVPVVMIAINDPVGTGLVASLARPGGHTTGMATLNEDLTPKILEFQRMIVPEAKILGILLNPANPSNPPMVDNIRARAGAMGVTVHSVTLRFPEELDAALAALAAGKPDALQLLGGRQFSISAIASPHSPSNIGCRSLRPGRRSSNWAAFWATARRGASS
jgi:putative ABC transport system substrate-binding protein